MKKILLLVLVFSVIISAVYFHFFADIGSLHKAVQGSATIKTQLAPITTNWSE